MIAGSSSRRSGDPLPNLTRDFDLLFLISFLTSSGSGAGSGLKPLPSDDESSCFYFGELDYVFSLKGC